MSSLEKQNDKALKIVFDKKVVSTTQHLQAYVKHRLYIAESTGIIPKNMYTSNDLIDEGIAKFYENGYDIDSESSAIKIKLFKIVDSDLDALFKREAFHKNTMSTHTILEEELDGLEENYTVDEDFDFIMNDELNDISYKQDHKHEHVFLYDDNNSAVISAFEIEDATPILKKNALGKFYTWLPFTVSDIIDLFVFGELTYAEIAKVKNIETKRVERILNLAIKTFRNHLD
ncbi:sigma-70 RNA polymerase sigma factor region 4 domain-containing protein [Changchengzhania lutea]|uniref:sigma-70 family RNA polymerase sigma factor n=1 Tax=Changchengzhania lutea TaxID=2049305 RepID=UPI00115C7CFA|nr:sigma-70 family RNA polymerase sigma factor [Changchengzhania lutea]